MPTKRKKLAARQIGLTESAVAAWRAGDFHGLNRALGIRPWQVSPFDAHLIAYDSDFTSPYPDTAGVGRAHEARAQLLEICPPGRVGRHGEPMGAADGN